MMHRKGETEVLRLKGVGLVHHPNLTLTGVASQDDFMNDERPFMHQIAKRLCLGDGASEEEIMNTLEGALGDIPYSEKFIPSEALQSVLEDRNLQVTSFLEIHVQAKVQDALWKGYITSGMTDWAMVLCCQNETSFDAFLDCSGRVLSKLLTSTHTTSTPPGMQNGAKRADSAEAASVCRQLGLAKTALNS